MIKLLTATALLGSLLPGLSLASSIETLASDPSGSSVEFIACGQCVVTPPPKATSYAVPVLKPGEQRREIRVIDGAPHLMMTDAMMGGSPVVRYALLTNADLAELNDPYAGPARAEGNAGIDLTAKTSAVSAQVEPQNVEPAKAETPKIKPLNVDSLELRGTEH